MEGNVVGAIAELNPPHNGHAHFLRQVREQGRAAFVVLVMSGDFVQRGEPAVLDKWTRSRIAVELGADLVLELPVCYATASGPLFAAGGMQILRSLKAVTHVAFGSESGDLADLMRLADLDEEDPAFRAVLREGLDRGLPYGRALTNAYTAFLGEETALLEQPNLKLAVSYLKERGNLSPVLIERDDSFPSGSEIRDLLQEGTVAGVPGLTEKALQETPLCFPEQAYPYLRQLLLTRSPGDLRRIWDMREGLEHRILEQARACGSWEELVQAVKSKRYPYRSVSRLLLHVLLDLTGDDFPVEEGRGPEISYARILAVSGKGRELLRMLKAREDLSVTLLQDAAGEPFDRLHAADLRAADLYNLMTGRDVYKDSDYVRHPYVQNPALEKG